MYGKILIQCRLKVLTGMHIGGSSAFSAIGAVDSPVINDPTTKQPILPGSSLKGKLRTLLARSFSSDITDMPNHNDDNQCILRLFGSSSNPIIKARLQFADAFISNASSFGDIPLTEIKFENTIDRITSVANPRQIERVISGVEFAVRIVYDIHAGVSKEEIEEDMSLLARAMRLLQLDYLGGHGTRGSGRISFEEIKLLMPLECEHSIEPNVLRNLETLFSDVEKYELLSV